MWTTFTHRQAAAGTCRGGHLRELQKAGRQSAAPLRGWNGWNPSRAAPPRQRAPSRFSWGYDPQNRAFHQRLYRPGQLRFSFQPSVPGGDDLGAASLLQILASELSDKLLAEESLSLKWMRK